MKRKLTTKERSALAQLRSPKGQARKNRRYDLIHKKHHKPHRGGLTPEETQELEELDKWLDETVEQAHGSRSTLTDHHIKRLEEILDADEAAMDQDFRQAVGLYLRQISCV
jgi:hypothetical protein